jgi:hypothetical protein
MQYDYREMAETMQILKIHLREKTYIFGNNFRYTNGEGFTISEQHSNQNYILFKLALNQR